MAKKSFDNESAKKELGELIVKCRGNMSLRHLARQIGIPPSNLTYIEKGRNVPTPEIYLKIIETLNPSYDQQKHMNKLYSEIRKLPSPQVCCILLDNKGLADTLERLSGKHLTEENIEAIEKLISTF